METEAEPFPSPCFTIYCHHPHGPGSAVTQTDARNRSNVFMFCWKLTSVYKIPKIISLGENTGLKNKPNLKIKTMLTQKNELILEAGNSRFNCVDLSCFSPTPFSTALCWKRLRAARALIHLLWQTTPMLLNADLTANSYFKCN